MPRNILSLPRLLLISSPCFAASVPRAGVLLPEVRLIQSRPTPNYARAASARLRAPHPPCIKPAPWKDPPRKLTSPRRRFPAGCAWLLPSLSEKRRLFFRIWTYRSDKTLGHPKSFVMSTAVATTALSPPPPPAPWEEDEALFHLLDKLEAFKIEGRDKRGRRILRIIGKFFPARVVKPGSLIRYLEERIFPELLGKKGKGGPFVVVYAHTYVERLENFPGVSALRSIYENLAPAVHDNLEAVYFVHPGLQSRLFFATFGRFLFSAGLYGKLTYVSRLEFLWEHLRRGEVEVPEFVHDHDDELEHRPLMDYGLESDHHHHRAYDAPAMDSAASMYSLRCIS